MKETNLISKTQKFFKEYSKEINATWGLIRSCTGAIGSVTTQQNKLAYVHAGVDVKNSIVKFYDTIKYSYYIRNFSNLEKYFNFYEFWVSLINENFEPEKLPNFGNLNEDFYSVKINDEINVLWSKERATITSFLITENKELEWLEFVKELLGKTRGKFLSLKRCAKSTWDVVPIFNYSNVENKLAYEISEKIEKYSSKGYGRSILFYGVPGTGKTNLANTIAKKLDKNCLSLGNAHEFFNSFDGDDIGNFIDILGIDIIIIDDIDHVPFDNKQVLLKKMEQLRSNGKTILATANDIGNLDNALKRPGRFDEIIEINKLNESTVMELVNQDIDLFNLCKDFPVSFIVELMKRVDVLGKEEALKEESIKDLIDRAYVLMETEES